MIQITMSIEELKHALGNAAWRGFLSGESGQVKPGSALEECGKIRDGVFTELWRDLLSIEVSVIT